MHHSLGGTLGLFGVGVVLAVVAGLFFYFNLGHYHRISGHALEIAFLRTLALVGVVVGSGALAWWIAGLFFAPGMGWNLALFFAYSLIQSTLGRGVLYLMTLVVERRYHL